MASAFDWIKLGLENSKVVLPIILLLVSTTGYTINDNMNKSGEIEASQKQLTNVANYYSKKDKVVEPSKCGSCDGQIESHNREYHQ